MPERPFTTLSANNIWCKGYYLAERASSSVISKLEYVQSSEYDLVHHWCERTGLPIDFLEHRLSIDGLDPYTFQKILTMKDHLDLQGLSGNDWDELLNTIFSSEFPPVVNEDFFDDEVPEHFFFGFISPFLEWSKMSVLEKFQSWSSLYSELPFSKSDIIKSILQHIGRILLVLSGRVLIYELNLARIEGRLKGDSPEARFEDFVTRYLSDKFSIQNLLKKYPVLARLMSESTQKLTDSVLEALLRFIEDKDRIEQHFTGDFSEIKRIHTGLGDFHRNGRSVMIMEFSSGNRLVYKPRPLEVDCHFNELLSWLNKRGALPAFKPLEVLNRSNYGWQQYVSSNPCQSRKQVSNYFKRLGGYIAILHILHATDIHMENMIVDGEHPYFIDLESLFQNFNPTDTSEMTALQKASNELSQSVLRVGILPASLFKRGSFKNIDLSGLGGHAGQELPRPVYGFEHEKTDRMRMVKKRGFSKGADNQLIFEGKAVEPQHYVEEIVFGFEQVYHILLHNKEELLAENGPIFVFKKDRVRSILRNTQSYATMLEAGLHPDYLKDGLDRVQLFDTCGEL